MALETALSGVDDGFLSSLNVDMDDFFSDELAAFLNSEFDLGDTMLMDVIVPSAPQALKTPGPGACTPSLSGNSTLSACTLGRFGVFPASCAPMNLAIQRCSGPPTSSRNAKNRGPVSMVSLEEPRCSFPRQPARVASLGSENAEQSDDECDSEGSDDTEEYEGAHAGASKKGNKRKVPEVDWRGITDPSERRRQRRLAKNRMTAARSRERKKVQWADLEAQLSSLNSDNKRLKSMLEQLSRENSLLRGQLAHGTGPAAVPTSATGSSSRSAGTGAGSAERGVLVFVSLLLLLCCSMPGEKALLLGSALPLVLLAAARRMSSDAAAAAAADRQALSDSLLRCLVSIKVLLSKSCKRLQYSVSRLLYKRPQYMGRKALGLGAAWAQSGSCLLLQQQAAVTVHSRVKVKDEPGFDASLYMVTGGC